MVTQTEFYILNKCFNYYYALMCHFNFTVMDSSLTSISKYRNNPYIAGNVVVGVIIAVNYYLFIFFGQLWKQQ